jgi:hypothetical protein
MPILDLAQRAIWTRARLLALIGAEPALTGLVVRKIDPAVANALLEISRVKKLTVGAFQSRHGPEQIINVYLDGPPVRNQANPSDDIAEQDVGFGLKSAQPIGAQTLARVGFKHGVDASVQVWPAKDVLCARRLDDGIGRRQVDGNRDGCGWAHRLMALVQSAWAEPWRYAHRGGAVG